MFEGKFMVGDKMLTGDPSDITKLDKKLLEDSLVSKMNTPNPQNDGNSNGGTGDGGQGAVNNIQPGVPGNTPAIVEGAPDIKPNGKYDTPFMIYIPGGNNQPEARILAKALEDDVIRSKGRPVTVALSTYIFEDDANIFIRDFFDHKYPNRAEHQR